MLVGGDQQCCFVDRSVIYCLFIRYDCSWGLGFLGLLCDFSEVAYCVFELMLRCRFGI